MTFYANCLLSTIAVTDVQNIQLQERNRPDTVIRKIKLLGRALLNRNPALYSKTAQNYIFQRTFQKGGKTNVCRVVYT